MGASEKAVAVVMALPEFGCEQLEIGDGDGAWASWCRRHGIHPGVWTDRGCPVAVAAADAAVETDRPSIQAQALLLAAMDIQGGLGPEGGPHVLYDFRLWLRARADRIEAQP